MVKELIHKQVEEMKIKRRVRFGEIMTDDGIDDDLDDAYLHALHECGALLSLQKLKEIQIHNPLPWGEIMVNWKKSFESEGSL